MNRERHTVTCYNCGGDVIEPRSGDKWLCTICARAFPAEEIDLDAGEAHPDVK